MNDPIKEIERIQKELVPRLMSKITSVTASANLLKKVGANNKNIAPKVKTI